jgi:hypothetical protein
LPEGDALWLGKLERLDDVPLADYAHVAGKRGIDLRGDPGRCELGDDVEKLTVCANKMVRNWPLAERTARFANLNRSGDIRERWLTTTKPSR